MRLYGYLLGGTLGAAIIAFGFGLFFGAFIGHGLMLLALCAFIAFLLIGYFLPSVLAGHFDHPRMVQIVALNLLLGWTLFGWIAAIVWASWGNRVPSA
ncbi:MAG TPA: superinfection immunity protein [Dongiaceae bacterium]|nr:superinfection immunity protein [Dongiaceae bacterium]